MFTQSITHQKHRVVFYPVQNGDTSQIILSNGKRILFDFRHLNGGTDEGNSVINLNEHLRSELSSAGRDYFDVVAFTHGDNDHICNSTQFFELQHALKYQGEDRIKIKELWVPAAMLLEDNAIDERGEEYVLWKKEAKYRIKQGSGIRVFSKPEMLKQWLEANGLTVDSRRHLITDAGQIVPGFNLVDDGVEFFCHSPFVKHVTDGDIERNKAALIFQVRFQVRSTITNYLAVGDSTWDVLEDIVATTKIHHNEDRLQWHLFNIPHHCSYLAIGPDKGHSETDPVPEVKTLLLSGQPGAYIVSSSKPIGTSPAAYLQTQPPHVQAKNCYETYRRKVGGRKLLVTMEQPNESQPQPLEFEISVGGLSWNPSSSSGKTLIVSKSAPRAGK